MSPDVGAGIRNGLAFPASAVGASQGMAGPVRLVGDTGELLAVYSLTAGRAHPEVVLA